ncbi:hypothetical protein N8T08_007636 [Aspergillus melleus]|uniref:Uncharacterized protein n=1 Tax=Aspergillus melleus TaxID=138277 RepID=A0ACC3BED1_9EURO|nr:hypothetical protein N8T08_007636 [Aspergillus melleus]
MLSRPDLREDNPQSTYDYTDESQNDNRGALTKLQIQQCSLQEALEDSASGFKENTGHVEIASTLTDAVQDAWMVIESVPEQISQKTHVLGEIDKLAHPLTIVATNSSSIRSSRLVSSLSDERQCRFLNTHYIRPPEVPIMEIMTCGRTSAAVIMESAARMEPVRLEPLIVERESMGFVSNRIWAAIKREVVFVPAERVGTAEDIDRVFKANLHAAWGPCELMDMVGLQIVCDIEVVYIEERNVPAYVVEFIRQNYTPTDTSSTHLDTASKDDSYTPLMGTFLRPYKCQDKRRLEDETGWARERAGRSVKTVHGVQWDLFHGEYLYACGDSSSAVLQPP